jgi:hypothetical protein
MAANIHINHQNHPKIIVRTMKSINHINHQNHSKIIVQTEIK